MVNNSCFFLAFLGKQHAFDALLVVAAHEGGVVEVALLGRLLFGQDVTVVSMLSLHLTRTGETKSLLSTGICLYFWHFFLLFNC